MGSDDVHEQGDAGHDPLALLVLGLDVGREDLPARRDARKTFRRGVRHEDYWSIEGGPGAE